jgi:hypothetical protein
LAKAVLNLPIPEFIAEAEVEHGEYEVDPVDIVFDFEYSDIFFAILLAFAPSAP